MIGIFDANLNENPFGGKSLRLINIFQKIKDGHDITYFPIIPNGTRIPKYLKDIFGDRIQPIYYEAGKNPFLGKCKGLLHQQPGYNYSITNRAFNDSVSAQIKSKCIANNVKIIHIFDFYIASFFDLLSQDYPIIWDIGDSYWLIHKRRKWHSKFTLNTQRIHNYEMDYVQKFNATIFVGEADLKLYPAPAKNKIILIPNGVGEDFINYDRNLEKVVPDTIVFTGNMAFPPNIDAVTHFYTCIYPGVKKIVPDLKWFIVGTNPEEIRTVIKDDPDIIITGRVEDIRPYIARAKVYVAPIRFGGGIKNKLLEAMALGKDIVAYDRAVDGFCKGHNIKVSANSEEFVADIINALKTPSKLNAVNSAFVRKNYTWPLAVEKYGNLYNNLLKG